jgi:hypothetical protein
MTDGSGHFANLSVFALGYFECYPAVGNGFPNADGGISWREFGLGIQKPGAAGKGLMIADGNSMGELF